MSTLLDSHRADASRRDWQYIFHLDAALLFALVALSTLGLFVLYSSAGGDEQLLMRQIVRLGLAFGTLAIIAQWLTGETAEFPSTFSPDRQVGYAKRFSGYIAGVDTGHGTGVER